MKMRGGLTRGAAPAVLLAAVAGSTMGATAASANAQETQKPHAGMLRYPDVSRDKIVFVYANDLWTVARSGGVASPLASPAGQEMFPRFSPDGSEIVFQGNYDGDRDLYTIGAEGGVPMRVTHHPANETPTDWHSSGLIFHMGGTHGIGRLQELYRVSPEGGMPELLPVPYGANGAMSDDGEWIAYTPEQRDFRTWKRYVGGLASDVWLFNPRTKASRQITDWEGTDTLPMWHGRTVYYLSDAGPEHRLNIWSYDVDSQQRRQVTSFSDFDVKFPAMGPGANGAGEIVFQLGSGLHLLDLANGRTTEVEVMIPGAKPGVRPRMVDAAEHLAAGGVSATGKRVVVEARGDLWTSPPENGAPRQLTSTSGAAERNPSWSPSGRWIAYQSDESGEYNLYVTQSDGKGETKQLTDISGNYFFGINWSPDSDHILATDKAGAMHLIDVETGERTEIDRDEWANQPSVSWSGDSRWIAYDKSLESGLTSTIWIYDTESGESQQVTSGFFSAASPAFGHDGTHLFYVSHRDFTSPQYEDVGSTFVYSNTQKLIAVPLTTEVENPRLLTSDEEEWEEDEPETDEDAGEEGEEDADGADEADGDDAADDSADEDAVELSPIEGTWSGTASGLSALGLPDDELEYTFYIKRLEDGSFVGASESQGEVDDYDSVSFDEDTGALVTTSSQGPLSTKTEATLNGDTLSGTWTISGPLDASGPMTATRVGTEIADGKIKGVEGGGGSGGDAEPVEIDFDGFEARGFELPVASGSFNSLVSNDRGHLLYNSMGGGVPGVRLIDLSDEEPEEKTVINGAMMVDVSGDRKKILLAGQGNRWKIADARAGQSMEGSLSPRNLNTMLDPKAEWRQLLRDAWRRHRDFFYVANMHGVDWDAVYEQYDAMLDDAASREDLSYIIGEMIGELNVGHAYYWGGDVEGQPSENVGLLGVDFELASETGEDGASMEAYRVKKMYHGAPWDSDARNPMSTLGMGTGEGTYILRVNGVMIDTAKDPWAAFIGTAGRPTTLTVADALVGDDETRNEREIVIEPIGSDQWLRYRAWVEWNRSYVEEASSGKVGYIHVPDTGANGQNELFRQFFGQIGKEALLIDDRWTGGGQLPTRFIELLNRPRTNYWYRRDGKDWPWPYDSHQGPKAMLINGAAGSGGDMFPWLFKHNDLGPLIGTRTWGGLVGISTVPGLIDGGYTAVPNFGFYEKDGTWGIEGHGVDPDMRVIHDPTKLANGRDPQLDAGVDYLLREIERSGYEPPRRPAPPVRTGVGIPDDEK